MGGMSSPRPASHRVSHQTRSTSESSIELTLDLDGTGTSQIDTTVPFFDHLLTAFAKHSLVDLTVRASGDTHIDAHHTVEDTAIVLGRRILPPAEDEAVQRRLLNLLSGRRHHCLSAVCVIDGNGRARTRISDTIVAFKRLSAAEVDRYVACGEGLGKAGGYAIQGRAEAFVRFLSGSHSGVIGLPLFETRALLEAAGVSLG